MKRAASAGLAVLVLAGCASSGRHARVAQKDDLSGLRTVPEQVRASGTGPAVAALAVSGSITNGDRQTLRCDTMQLFVVDKNGNAVAPIAQYCAIPLVRHGSTAYFSATFETQETADLQLRMEHADGTYETHALALTAARQ